MSPASRSKSKDKSSAKAPKEQQKASSKPSTAPSNAGGNGIPASAYNPVSGTFHTLETAPTASSPPLHNNGRFRTIDETDDHSGSSLGTGAEYDSVSNNDSCSGESEDQKDKSASHISRPEPIPGSDNDKREKTRQKNEKKHQRQKERRAQELHERCTGYLMSRKLEALGQQLVAMGFSSERATMALILNEGRVEESVAWLFEGGEEAAQNKDLNLDSGGNLKIDIAEEMAQIADIEVRFKCTIQEVERAVVACEGDLKKAGETLRAQKLEPAAFPPKPEETGDPALNGSKLAVSANQNLSRIQGKAVANVTLQQRKDERDFNYAKGAVPMVASTESGTRNSQSLRRIQLKSEWARTQVAIPAEKRWPASSSSLPSVSYSLASPLQVAPPPPPPPPPTKAESLYVVGNEIKNIQTGTVREPVIMMQRPQSVNAKQSPTTSLGSSPPPGKGGWYPNIITGVETLKPNVGLGHLPSVGLSNSNPSSQQFYHQPRYQTFASSPMDSSATGWGGLGSWNTNGPPPSPSSSLALPSSLGLFTGWGSNGTSGSSSPVDWNTTGGSMPQCDYTNIDWSVDSSPSSRPNGNGLLLGLSLYAKSSLMYDGLSEISAGGKVTRSAGNGVVGLQERGGVSTDTSSSAGSHEWTSPFAGKDLFSLPRQFVNSPSP
ncbi:uncharacterized protein LOC143882094 [Tasmannia lanceolata]|uniref:uncharacterized protein LOC143882094 n=1 Tax=Tasmannia lanceolata TaxID=3420 RepID=UPI004064C75E